MARRKLQSVVAIALTGGVATFVGQPALAGEFALGVAGGMQTSLYRDLDDQNFVIPVIDYQGDRFGFFLDTASFRLASGSAQESQWRIRALATGRIFDQPKRRADLETRHSTVEAGLEGALRGEWGSLSLQATTDALDNHGGFEIELGYAYEFRATERLSFVASAEVSYYDAKLADYYFGVRASETRADRTEYQPGASGAASVGLMTTYGLTDHWTLVGVVEVMKLGEELADSPLIAEDTSTTAIIGAMYRF